MNERTKKAIALYGSGKTLKQISETLGSSLSYWSNTLRRAGVAMRRTSPLETAQRRMTVEAYRDAGIPMAEIARRMGISRTMLYKIIGRPQNDVREARIKSEVKEKAISMYRAGYSVPAISAETGMREANIRALMARNGVLRAHRL